MSETKSINIISRHKPPRRNEKKDASGKGSRGARDMTTAASSVKKNRDDLTFQNFDEIATPNKVGFDSLESAVGEPSKSEIQNFDIMHQSNSNEKLHKNQMNLVEERKDGLTYEDVSNYNTNNNLFATNNTTINNPYVKHANERAILSDTSLQIQTAKKTS